MFDEGERKLKLTRSKLEKILLAWSIKVQKWSIWIILFFVLITGWGFLYVSKNLGVNTDTSDMMSEKLQWRQDSIQFRATFPEEVKTILIVIEGHIPEHAYLAQTDLSVALEKKTDLYESIYVLGGGDFFWKNGLLFLPEKDLKKKIDIWQKMLPLMSILAKNPTIETLALSLATASQKEAQPSETFLKLVTGFNHAIESL